MKIIYLVEADTEEQCLDMFSVKLEIEWIAGMIDDNTQVRITKELTELLNSSCEINFLLCGTGEKIQDMLGYASENYIMAPIYINTFSPEYIKGDESLDDDMFITWLKEDEE